MAGCALGTQRQEGPRPQSWDVPPPISKHLGGRGSEQLNLNVRKPVALAWRSQEASGPRELRTGRWGCRGWRVEELGRPADRGDAGDRGH